MGMIQVVANYSPSSMMVALLVLRSSRGRRCSSVLRQPFLSIRHIAPLRRYVSAPAMSVLPDKFGQCAGDF